MPKTRKKRTVLQHSILPMAKIFTPVEVKKMAAISKRLGGVSVQKLLTKQKDALDSTVTANPFKLNKRLKKLADIKSIELAAASGDINLNQTIGSIIKKRLAPFKKFFK